MEKKVMIYCYEGSWRVEGKVKDLEVFKNQVYVVEQDKEMFSQKMDPQEKDGLQAVYVTYLSLDDFSFEMKLHDCKDGDIIVYALKNAVGYESDYSGLWKYCFFAKSWEGKEKEKVIKKREGQIIVPPKVGEKRRYTLFSVYNPFAGATFETEVVIGFFKKVIKVHLEKDGHEEEKREFPNLFRDLEKVEITRQTIGGNGNWSWGRYQVTITDGTTTLIIASYLDKTTNKSRLIIKGLPAERKGKPIPPGREVRVKTEKEKTGRIIARVFLPDEARGKIVFLPSSVKEEGKILILKKYEDKGRYIICQEYENFAGLSDDQLIGTIQKTNEALSKPFLWRTFIQKAARQYPLSQALNFIVEVPLESLERGIKESKPFLIPLVESLKKNLRNSGDVIAKDFADLLTQAEEVFRNGGGKKEVMDLDSFTRLACWIDKIQQH